MKYYIVLSKSGVIEYQTKAEPEGLVYDITSAISVNEQEQNPLGFAEIPDGPNIVRLDLSTLDELLSPLSLSLRFRAIDQIYFWYKKLLNHGYQLELDYNDALYSAADDDDKNKYKCSWLLPFTCMYRFISNDGIKASDKHRFYNLLAFTDYLISSQELPIWVEAYTRPNSLEEENYRFKPSTAIRASKTQPSDLMRKQVTVQQQLTLTHQHTQQQEQKQEQKQEHNHLQKQDGFSLGLDMWGAWKFVQKHAQRCINASNYHSGEYRYQQYQITDRFGITTDDFLKEQKWLEEIVAKKTIDTDIISGIFSLGAISDWNPLNFQPLSFQKRLELPTYSVTKISDMALLDLVSRIQYIEDGLSPYRQHCIDIKSLGIKLDRQLVAYDEETTNSILRLKPARPLFRNFPKNLGESLVTMNGVYAALFKTNHSHKVTINDTHAEFLYEQYHNYDNEFADPNCAYHILEWIKQYQTLSIYDEDLLKLWLTSGDDALINRDKLRIILHPFLMYGVAKTLPNLLSHLAVMSSVDLIRSYYLIHVQHAPAVSSLSDILFDENNSLIFELAHNSQKNAASIKREYAFQFVHHFLLYAAAHHIQIGTLNTHYIFNWYRGIEQLIESYAKDDIKEADRLKNLFITSICTYKGLSIAPVKLATTFFEGLLTIIKHAISQHCLEEQLECLEGISVAWRDAPYALLNNGYRLAHKQMNLVRKQLHPYLGCYNVLTPYQLKDKCINNYENYVDLNTELFRYLGTISLSQSFANYHHLAKSLSKHPSHNQQLDTILLVMFVLLTTGSNDGLSCEVSFFKEKINEWFSSSKRVSLALKDRLESIMPYFSEIISQGKSTTSLWKIYQELKQRRKPSQQSQSTSFFTMFFTSSTFEAEEVPAVYTRSFSPQNFYQFLKNHQKDIQAPKEFLSKHPLMPYTIFIELLKCHARKTKIERHVLENIAREYVRVSIEQLFNELDTLEMSLVEYGNWSSCSNFPRTVDSIQALLQNTSLTHTGIALNILSQQMILINQPNNNAIIEQFLFELKDNFQLLINKDIARAILPILIAFYLRTQPEISQLQQLMRLSTVALNTSNPRRVITVILSTVRSREGEKFWNRKDICFNSLQLENITRLIEHTEKAIPWIDWCLEQDVSRDFRVLIPYIDRLPAQHFEAMLNVTIILLSAGKQVSDKEINAICSQSSSILNYMCSILKKDSSCTALQASDIVMQLIYSSDPSSFMDEIEERFLERHIDLPIDKLDLDAVHIQLNMISSDKEDESFINKREALFESFIRTMQYCKTTLFLNNRGENVLLRNLNKTSCLKLYNELSKKLVQFKTPEEQSLYLEQLLALCCIIVFRITGQFPRPMQCMAVLNTQTNLHELPTGSGKSLIVALYAMIDNARRETPDIATQNSQLASAGIRLYADCYKYLGIPFASEPIDATDSKGLYKKGQIHYFTFENLVFFACQNDLRTNSILLNKRLLIDEVDLILNTPLMCRLAANIGLFLTQQQWDVVLQMVVDFVRNKDLFLNNSCSAADDRYNLQLYLKTRIASLSNESKHIVSLPAFTEQDYDELIDSALTADSLIENQDFVLLNKSKDTMYAAPILKQTDRPCINVSYGGYTQAFLHMSLKKKYPYINFEECAKQDVIVSVHPSALLKWTKETSFAGFSGTLSELAKDQNFSIFKYPHDNFGVIEELPVQIAKNSIQHKEMLADFIHNWQEINPQHSILVFLPSPEAVYNTRTALNSSGILLVDIYEGFDSVGSAEMDAIIRAGEKGRILLTTLAWARGIDIIPDSCLTVVNGCTNVDEEMYIQLRGRTGRNGRKGYFISIINGENLDLSSNPDVLSSNWQDHRQQLLIAKQTERVQAQELIELRHKLVFEHYFKRIQELRSLIVPWYGYFYSILKLEYNQSLLHYIDNDLMRWLNELNQKIEKTYNAYSSSSLLNDKLTELCNAHAKPFFDILSSLDDKIISVNKRPFEWLPLIILRAPDTLTIKDITLLSGLIRMWDGNIGYSNSRLVHKFLDENYDLIQDCVYGESSHISAFMRIYERGLSLASISLKEKLMACLATIDYIPEISITSHISLLKDSINNGDWDAAFCNAKAWLISQFRVINLTIGWIPMIMKFFPSVDIKHLGNKIDHLQKLIYWFLTLDNPLNNHVKEYLDIIEPLIDGSTLRYLFPSNIQEETIQIYIDIIISGFSTLRAYDNLTLKECLHHEQLLKIILDIFCMPQLRDKMHVWPKRHLLPYYDKETLNRVLLFKDIPLMDFLYLLKTLSHPLIHTLLISLPESASVRDLSDWIVSECDDTIMIERPYEVDEAFKKLEQTIEDPLFSRTPKDWVSCFSLNP